MTKNQTATVEEQTAPAVLNDATVGFLSRTDKGTAAAISRITKGLNESVTVHFQDGKATKAQYAGFDSERKTLVSATVSAPLVLAHIEKHGIQATAIRDGIASLDNTRDFRRAQALRNLAGKVARVLATSTPE